MRSLGVDPDDRDRPDLALTPRRLAKAYADLRSGWSRAGSAS